MRTKRIIMPLMRIFLTSSSPETTYSVRVLFKYLERVDPGAFERAREVSSLCNMQFCYRTNHLTIILLKGSKRL